jgi:Mlc titration factor MtfA (ptsG expression regulator)
MDMFLIALVVIAVLVLLFYAVFTKKKRSSPVQPLPGNYRQLLIQYVDFYSNLDPDQRAVFENRMQLFLSRIRITGVGTEAEGLDKVLIAASAIIPIFGFPDWEYMNLNEVLLYPDSFNETFEQEGNDRHTLGLVGSGPYQNIMILSRHELRNGFINKTGKENTAIHEFVHLVDKTDGAVDGVPEFLLSKQYVLPWLNLVHTEIKEIMKNRSDINPYGATDQVEFFAVISEYFFERPDLLQNKHPELYDLLAIIFRQRPKTTN